MSILLTSGSIILGALLYSRLTNPFLKSSIIVKDIVLVKKDNGEFKVTFTKEPKIRKNFVAQTAAVIKSGTHILASRFGLDPKAKGQTVDEIIGEINARRFSPNNMYIISGDHFSVLYPRSLGIFYHSLLDPRIPRTDVLWDNQQALYLKTTAYALSVFEKAGRLSTTVVPTGRRSVTLINIYAPPSDTLYSLLFALMQLSNDEYHLKRYPYKAPIRYTLATKHAAKDLLKRFAPSLLKHMATYEKMAVDQETGLIKKDILLSGTKDISKRSCAFYDNVILWKTRQLAQKLGLAREDPASLSAVKHSIIDHFWLEREGYFLEDLAPQSVESKQYSSDFLIAVQTGFLSPSRERERVMLERSVDHIMRDRIDKPFGLRYQNNFAPERLYTPVRIGARTYGSTAIWSHWGMEYIKLLTMLYCETHKILYLEAARKQLDAYEENIVTHKGFPEVYDENGNFYRSPTYRSVRQTGWAVNFLQARAMLKSVS